MATEKQSELVWDRIGPRSRRWFTRRALQLGAGRRDLPAGERGVAGGLGVALEDQDLGAAFIRGQRRDGAAGAGTDDEDGNVGGEGLAFDFQDGH